MPNEAATVTHGALNLQNMRRFLAIFTAAIVGTAVFHEVGHSAAAWAQGLPSVPTPFKEYVLQSDLPWSVYVRIAAGGLVGTAVAVLATGVAFVRRPGADTDAAFAGAWLMPAAYSLRYALAGRGHDGLEWQAAQAALGFAPTGHAADLFFCAVAALGAGLWMTTRRPSITLRAGMRCVALFVFGLIVLVLGQLGNNAAFDHAFPATEVTHVPSDVLASRH